MKYLNNFKLFESVIQKVGYDVVRNYLGEERKRDKRRDAITIRDLSVIYDMLFELGEKNNFTKINHCRMDEFKEETSIELIDLKKVMDGGATTSVDRLWSTHISMMKEGYTSVQCARKSSSSHDRLEFTFYKFEDEWWIIRQENSSSLSEPHYWICDGYDGIKNFAKETL